MNDPKKLELKNMETAEKSSTGLLDIIIDKLIEERTYHIAYQSTKETTEYDKWSAESIVLSRSIIKILGIDHNLFDRYEELITDRESAFLQKTYTQGFKDGVELFRSLLYEGKI